MRHGMSGLLLVFDTWDVDFQLEAHTAADAQAFLGNPHCEQHTNANI